MAKCSQISKQSLKQSRKFNLKERKKERKYDWWIHSPLIGWFSSFAVVIATFFVCKLTVQFCTSPARCPFSMFFCSLNGTGPRGVSAVCQNPCDRCAASASRQKIKQQSKTKITTAQGKSPSHWFFWSLHFYFASLSFTNSLSVVSVFVCLFPMSFCAMLLSSHPPTPRDTKI